MPSAPQPRPNPRTVAPQGVPSVTPTSASRYVRKKKPLWKSPVLWLLLIAVGAAGGGTFWFLNQRSLALLAPGDQFAQENEPFRLTLQTRVKGLKPGDYKFELLQGPPGAALDATTGVLSWSPNESHGPGRYEVQVRAVAVAHPLPEATAAFVLTVEEDSRPPKLAAVPDQVLDLNQTKTLTVALQGTDDDLPKQTLKYELIDGKQYGAALDAATGKLTFDGAKAKPDQTFAITVAVFDSEKVASKAVTFHIKTTGLPSAYDAFISQARKAGLDLKLIGAEPAPLFDVAGKVHSIEGQRLVIYEFPSADAAAQASVGVIPDASTIAGKPIPTAREAEVYVADRLIFVFLGATEPGARLVDLLGRRLADRTPVAALPASMPKTVIESTEPKVSEYDLLIKLYKEKKLFSLKEYATVRKFYADRFAKENADLIKQIFGDDAELQKFFEKNNDVKEELYTAIDPKFDNVAGVLTLFRDLHRQFPAKFQAYSELAIATAVTWDDERHIVDYAGHQRRVRAILPEQRTGAVENFKYLLDAEPVMQGRVQFLPWEFLVHTVNDRTPIAERMWAVQRYLPKRVMFGGCYHDVPYDTEALETNDKVTKLDGKPYTLANLDEFGGVCAHQADFASRVGKSLGVPAEYVGGTASDGIGHAWVMWIELKQVTGNGIVFSLESYGRYRGDNYYVGNLRDPHTGQRITDRQLELRLHTIGMNVPAKRHADRVMAAYTAIRDELKFPVKEQLAFLNSLLQLCVGNEAGWHAVAEIAKNNSEFDKNDEKIMVTALDTLFRMFAKVPDFTFEVFDDLIGFRKDAKDKIALYQRLVQLYDQAKRPDLACDAVMRLADKLAADSQQTQACQSLIATILRYPEEGRHIPKLVDQLDKLSQGMAGADMAFVQFYQKFLPTIPRGSAGMISPYCIAMYQRGIKKYRDTGNEALAVEAEAELQKIKNIGKT